jgi:hypothetical protein
LSPQVCFSAAAIGKIGPRLEKTGLQFPDFNLFFIDFFPGISYDRSG